MGSDAITLSVLQAHGSLMTDDVHQSVCYSFTLHCLHMWRQSKIAAAIYLEVLGAVLG